MATLIGSGTLYDEDENELSTVAYRDRARRGRRRADRGLGRRDQFDAATDIALAPGRYLLELEDGTRGLIAIEPTGAAWRARARSHSPAPA